MKNPISSRICDKMYVLRNVQLLIALISTLTLCNCLKIKTQNSPRGDVRGRSNLNIQPYLMHNSKGTRVVQFLNSRN